MSEKRNDPIDKSVKVTKELVAAGVTIDVLSGMEAEEAEFTGE